MNREPKEETMDHDCSCVICDAPGCQICRDPEAREIGDFCDRCGWEQDGIGGQTTHPYSLSPNQLSYRSALIKELVDGMDEAGVWTNPRTRSATHRLLRLPSEEEARQRDAMATIEGMVLMKARFPTDEAWLQCGRDLGVLEDS